MWSRFYKHNYVDPDKSKHKQKATDDIIQLEQVEVLYKTSLQERGRAEYQLVVARQKVDVRSKSNVRLCKN
jgi:hypothetical protein